MTLAQRLQAYLTQRGWKPNQLDREAKLSAGSTARYLLGHEPTLKSLRLLAAQLGVEPNDLVDKEPPKLQPPPEPHGASQ